MEFDIKEYVNNPEDPELQETYEIVNDLVNRAGHITIRDLYSKDRNEIGVEAWDAIQRAKGIGFLAISNTQCCSGKDCVDADRGWCSKTPEGRCAIASTVCKKL